MILQCICKKCSHILLDESKKERYRGRLNNPNLDYKEKKAIRKKIIDECKKVRICPSCKELNGVVKKISSNKAGVGSSVLKIGHEKFRDKKEKDIIVQEQMG